MMFTNRFATAAAAAIACVAVATLNAAIVVTAQDETPNSDLCSGITQGDLCDIEPTHECCVPPECSYLEVNNNIVDWLKGEYPQYNFQCDAIDWSDGLGNVGTSITCTSDDGYLEDVYLTLDIEGGMDGKPVSAGLRGWEEIIYTIQDPCNALEEAQNFFSSLAFLSCPYGEVNENIVDWLENELEFTCSPGELPTEMYCSNTLINPVTGEGARYEVVLTTSDKRLPDQGTMDAMPVSLKVTDTVNFDTMTFAEPCNALEEAKTYHQDVIIPFLSSLSKSLEGEDSAAAENVDVAAPEEEVVESNDEEKEIDGSEAAMDSSAPVSRICSSSAVGAAATAIALGAATMFY